MNALNENQLKIMREKYPGFGQKERVARLVRADTAHYKKNPGYVPFTDGDDNVGQANDSGRTQGMEGEQDAERSGSNSRPRLRDVSKL